jgi:hypothetical protein
MTEEMDKPCAFEAVRVNFVEVVGDTVVVPTSLTEPRSGLIFTEPALVTSQVSVDRPPGLMIAGPVLNRFMTGTSLGCEGTGAVAGAFFWVPLAPACGVAVAVTFAVGFALPVELLEVEAGVQQIPAQVLKSGIRIKNESQLLITLNLKRN